MFTKEGNTVRSDSGTLIRLELGGREEERIFYSDAQNRSLEAYVYRVPNFAVIHATNLPMLIHSKMTYTEQMKLLQDILEAVRIYYGPSVEVSVEHPTFNEWLELYGNR